MSYGAGCSRSVPGGFPRPSVRLPFLRQLVGPDIRRLQKFIRSDVPFQITIANFASLVFSFLTVPVIARAVGAEGRGETAAVVAAFVFVPVLLGLGIPLEVRRRS